MRYRLKTHDYITERFSFDLTNIEAWSYGWWRFVEVLKDGTVLYNAAAYSRQTNKHQRMAKKILDHNKIGCLYIWVKCGLQNIPLEISNYEFEISQLLKACNNPRAQKRKNIERKESILQIRAKIEYLKYICSLQGSPNKPRKPLKPLPAKEKKLPIVINNHDRPETIAPMQAKNPPIETKRALQLIQGGIKEINFNGGAT